MKNNSTPAPCIVTSNEAQSVMFQICEPGKDRVVSNGTLRLICVELYSKNNLDQLLIFPHNWIESFEREGKSFSILFIRNFNYAFSILIFLIFLIHIHKRTVMKWGLTVDGRWPISFYLLGKHSEAPSFLVVKTIELFSALESVTQLPS